MPTPAPPRLAAWLLFAVDPSDRALHGWCPVGAEKAADEAAARKLISLSCTGGL
jgi:hypothetical protein